SESTPRTSSTAARQRASQSVKRVEEQARRELGIEVGALLRHRLAASRHRPNVLDLRGAKQERRLGVAAVDGCDCVGPLWRVGNGGLVEMVAVRNQKLRALEVRGIPDAPKLVAAASEIGSAVGRLERFTLVEEKDRLELGARGTEEAEPALLRAAMRALVRKDGAALVRLGSQRGDESGPRPGNAVRPHVILRETPAVGLCLPG